MFAYSRQGCRTAKRVLSALSGEELRAYTMERFSEPGFLPLGRPARGFYGELFSSSDALVFVGSCGIAVREIAPHVKDKRTDPAVICIDELGRYVIPLLSGHIGGANELARRLASALGAEAVVTTATDINNRFSVDAWAAKQGFVIDDMAAAKAVSAAVLERAVPLSSDFPVATPYPAGTEPGSSGELGICISFVKKSPFERTLRLIPRILHLGIGCRRGTPAGAIAAAVDAALEPYGIDPRALKCAASIDLKADEPGLLSYCRENGLPLYFYSAEELMAVPGSFTPSEFVRSVTGADNVCERAALCGACRLIVKKTALNGVTVAVAAENLEVRFE